MHQYRASSRKRPLIAPRPAFSITADGGTSIMFCGPLWVPGQQIPNSVALPLGLPPGARVTSENPPNQPLPPNVAVCHLARLDLTDLDRVAEFASRYGHMVPDGANSDLHTRISGVKAVLPLDHLQRAARHVSVVLREKPSTIPIEARRWGFARDRWPHRKDRMIEVALELIWDGFDVNSEHLVWVPPHEWRVERASNEVNLLTVLNSYAAPSISAIWPEGVEQEPVSGLTALAAQLIEELTAKRGNRECLSDTCHNLFSIQDGRSVSGQHRKTGALYCSKACARNHGQRKRRERARRQSGKDVEPE